MLKLNLGSGKRPREGWVNVDISADCQPELVCDLTQTPWPWSDAVVEQVYCNHLFEHLDGRQRIAFMEELWRVLVPGGQALIVTPYWASWRAVADPTHVFPPVVEQSFLYFSRDWRVKERLDHYPIKCNFDFECQYVFNPDVGFPDEEARAQGGLHYINVVDDLRTLLTKQE